MADKHTAPKDIAALEQRIAELQVKLASARRAGDPSLAPSAPPNSNSATSGINTGGGAVVHDSVKVANGHFIGRDSIQYITNVVHSGEDPDQAKSVVALYLHALAADLAGLKLGEIDLAATDTHREPLQLADVYVPLDTTLTLPEDMTLPQWLARGRQQRDDALLAQPGERPLQGIDAAANRRETRNVTALEALASHRELTLIGQPGSGKSTFGASVLLAHVQAWQGHSGQLETLGEHWTHGTLLPIRILLRRFAEQLPAGDGAARAGDLWDFVRRDLDAAGYGMCARTLKYLQRIARHSGAIILLDGLDECGSAANRARVLAAVQELMRSAGINCRFLLTARPYAWAGGADPRQGVYKLADLNYDQIEQFIRGWYQALSQRGWLSAGEAERKLADLLAARGRPDLAPLAGNPLLLTLMATLHTNRGRLPDDRADLYDESVDLLMLRWNRQIGADRALLAELALPGLKLSDLREVLEELAFQVHGESAVEAQDGDTGAGDTADIGEDRLVRTFCPLLNSRDKAAIVVDYIEKRAGLLVGLGERAGERRFSFPHRTFQEFLAAAHLAAQDDFPAACARLARAAPGHWQVVLPLAARLAKTERGASAADELIGSASISELCRPPDAADWNCALLAGMQLAEIGSGAIMKRERTQAIAARVAGWLTAALPLHPADGGLPATQRATAGDVLAALGDPRFDPDRFHLPADDQLGFVEIPADPGFRIGTRRADAERVGGIIGGRVTEDEINDAVTPTPAFYIARFPVTVAQFRAFVEATGFELADRDAPRDPDNRPVRWVSWHEALRYCAWLTDTLRTDPNLADTEPARLVREKGWQVTLPSELEWEKAARGTLAAAVFPWGDDPDPNRANYRASELGTTSAVGCFPANGFGLYDMTGNVFEWTRSLWGEDWEKPDFMYPYSADDSKREALDAGDDVRRVVRGGSWNNAEIGARCAYRSRVHTGNQLDFLGFRVLLRAAPVP